MSSTPKEHGFNCSIKEANWDKYGKRAGMIRNEEMARQATDCIVFWDRKSKGTANMIELAEKYNLRLKVVKYE